MFDVFMYAINAIFPIIILILFGYFLKVKGFVQEDFLQKINKFVFKWCLPVLLFYNVYNIDSFSSINWSVVIYAVLIILVIFALGVLTVLLFVKDRARKGVILQCIFRSNFSIIGIPLAEALGGPEAIQIAAILSAFTIPVFNILAVISLSIYNPSGEENKISFINILINIVKNPLIIGVVSGLVFLGIRQFIPLNNSGNPKFFIKDDVTFLYTAIGNIAKIASPLALIALGGLFNFSQVKGMFKEIIVGTSWRLVIAPVIGLGVALLLSKYTNILNFDNNVYPALIALFGSPVAVSSAIMASEMKNDGILAGQLVVWTSIISIVTIFITVVLFRSAGIL